MKHAQILSRVLNRPLLVTPDYLEVALSGVSERLGLEQITDGDKVLQGDELKELAGTYHVDRPYERGAHYQLDEGVAIIDVRGALVSRTNTLRPYSGTTGYDSIKNRLEYAVSDPDVSGILLDLDSSGGEVTGLFDLIEYMQSVKGKKPVHALISGRACSACFAIASQADHRMITQDSYAGSVGVVLAHNSLEKHLDKEGIKVTFIHAGAYKVTGNPYQDLSEDVKTELQAAVNATYDKFSQIVGEGLGMDVEAVKSTEARVYETNAALAIGFADQLVNGFDAIDTFKKFLSERTTTTGAIQMTQANSAQPGNTATQQGAESTQEASQANTEAAGRQRIKSIMALGAAGAAGAQLSNLTQAIALDTDLDAEQATSLIKAASQDLEAAQPEVESEHRDPALDFGQAVSQLSADPTETESSAAKSGPQGNKLLAALNAAQGKL